MHSTIRKYIDAFRQFKFGIVAIALNRLLPDMFKYKNLIIFTFDLQKSADTFPIVESSVEVHKVDDPEDERFRLFREKFPAPEFLNRLKKDKESAYLAVKEGEVVAYAWVTENQMKLEAINHQYPLGKGEIYLYSCYVSPEHRGEGIHSRLIHERLRDYMKDDRYTTAYTGVLAINQGSIKGVERAGFREKKRIRYLNILGKEKWWGIRTPAPT